MRFAEARADIYPYLLVNIGSGVSMIKVSGPRKYGRIGGTSLGGGTLWGLLSLLTGARTFDDMLAMAEKGDNSAVDMLVGDIYGTDYNKIGLKSTTIASSFGKVFRMKRQAERDAEDGGGLANGDRHQHLDDYALEDDRQSFSAEDMSRSLLYAIRYARNITRRVFGHRHPQLTMLQQQHRPDRISAVRKAQSPTHLLWWVLHQGSSADDEHTVLRYKVLVQRREESILSST